MLIKARRSCLSHHVVSPEPGLGLRAARASQSFFPREPDAFVVLELEDEPEAGATAAFPAVEISAPLEDALASRRWNVVDSSMTTPLMVGSCGTPSAEPYSFESVTV